MNKHVAQYPQLTADIGNITLPKLCGELELIDKVLAGDVADANHGFPELQHQIRLQGSERARGNRMDGTARSAGKKQLWSSILACLEAV